MTPNTNIDFEVEHVPDSVREPSDIDHARGQPCFFAFDLLMSEGKDLRLEKLTDRKHELRRMLPRLSGRLQYA